MKRWGIVITAGYAVIVLALLGPGLALLSGLPLSSVANLYTTWLLWLWVGAVVGGEALLLFLSVDTSRRLIRSRRHVLLSVLLGGLMLALLTAAAVWSVDAAVFGDQSVLVPRTDWGAIGTCVGLWILWAVAFWLYHRRSSEALEKVLSWVLRGSVLELLVAVPCHIIVRQRNDCSAPIVSGFGIVTGIAVMLVSFGPGVLFLFRRRMEVYRKLDAPGE